MGFKLKRAFSNAARPFKAVARTGKAIGGMFKGPKMPGDSEGGPSLYSEARSRAAGAGTVNFTEEGYR